MPVRSAAAVVSVLALICLGGTADAAASLKGAVTTPLTLDQTTLQGMPATTVSVSFETGKGKETGTYTGVLLWDLLAKAELVNEPGKNSELRHTLLITGSDGYAVAVALGEFDSMYGAKQILLAYRGSDPAVSFDHPRLVVPGDLHGGRAVKDVASIDVK